MTITDQGDKLIYRFKRLWMTEHVRWLRATRNKEVIELFNVERTCRICVDSRALGRDYQRLHAIEAQRIGQSIALDNGSVPVIAFCYRLLM